MALKRQQAESLAQDAVEEALKAGKIQPCQRESALRYALSDMEGFRTFVEKSLPVLPLGELTLRDDSEAGEGSLTSPETFICRALGITPEAFKAQERELRAERLL